MHRQLVSVFYKQQTERPTIDLLLHPEHLRPGDRFTRVFQGEMEFSSSSNDDVLDELFATFNGHGKALPPTLLPRSICVGDIVVINEENAAFVITPNRFDKLPFVPSGENFEIPKTISRQLAPTNWRTLPKSPQPPNESTDVPHQHTTNHGVRSPRRPCALRQRNRLR